MRVRARSFFVSKRIAVDAAVGGQRRQCLVLAWVFLRSDSDPHIDEYDDRRPASTL
jgi:hypothetical protein